MCSLRGIGDSCAAPPCLSMRKSHFALTHDRHFTIRHTGHAYHPNETTLGRAKRSRPGGDGPALAGMRDCGVHLRTGVIEGAIATSSPPGAARPCLGTALRHSTHSPSRNPSKLQETPQRLLTHSRSRKSDLECSSFLQNFGDLGFDTQNFGLLSYSSIKDKLLLLLPPRAAYHAQRRAPTSTRGRPVPGDAEV